MIIAIGSDHGGYGLKEEVKKHFDEKQIQYKDFGTSSEESVNYPNFAEQVAMSVQKQESEFGVLICSSGVGMSIVANKFKGIRCALVHNEHTAEYSRLHNNSNVIALGAKEVTKEEAIKLIDIFLNTNFEGGRHETRVNLISEIENRNMR